MRRVAGILLAGGWGRRFGGDKLLRRLPDGTPIGVAAARNLMAALPWSVAVVRHADQRLAALLAAEGMEVVACDTSAGLSASVRAGVGSASEAHSWVLALADMPFIRPATIRAIAVMLHSGVPIVAPVYRGTRGHPVGVGQVFRDELLALSGDRGARGLIARYGSQLRLHHVDDPGILMDIDTPEDLAVHLG